ncbi:hypothetical protein DICVIV_11226 [Dictyocaulus viviparus]|uniref:Uncharacterized protein n=1 Tax=Dictyocaulus viviparus TaxID=29172 RepID=A0A0D8XGE7_DICVI|nr:hypothetical protein DICVIV_11226 [Dictyocaulus viviparus]
MGYRLANYRRMSANYITPRCGSQLITIEVKLNPHYYPGGKFTDWIVVGVSGFVHFCATKLYFNEIKCKSHTLSILIIHLEPAPGVFQNRIRIGQNPAVILQGDQTLTVKCVYGLPEVEALPLPFINPNFNVESDAKSSSSNLPVGAIIPTTHTLAGVLPQPASNPGRVGSSFLGITGNSQDGKSLANGGDASIGTHVEEFLKRQNVNNRLTGQETKFKDLLNSRNGEPKAIIPQLPPRITDRTGSDGTKNINDVSNSNADKEPAEHSGGLDSHTTLDSTGAGAQQRSRAKHNLSVWLLPILLGAVLLALCVLCCLYICLRKRDIAKQNRSRLLVGANNIKDNDQHLWWGNRQTIRGDNTDFTSERHRNPAVVSPADSQETSSTAQATRSASSAPSAKPRGIFKKNSGKNIDRENPVQSIRELYSGPSKDGSEGSHYASSGFYVRRQFELDGLTRQQENKVNYVCAMDGPAPSGMNLRSNLEEYVQRAQSQRNSQRSQYASRLEFNEPDLFSERGVDIGSDMSGKPIYSENTNKMLPKSYLEWRHCLIAGSSVDRTASLKEQDADNLDDYGISSYRSMTEIYHAAETAEQENSDGSHTGELLVERRDVPSIEVLEKCVLPIRGFGARKLTEQELGRWRQLITRNSMLRRQLLMAKDLQELIEISKQPEYYNLYTAEKWAQILECVHKALIQKSTSSIEDAASNSQLNVYIGNIGSDW